MNAGGAAVAPVLRQAWGGAIPAPALHDLTVLPIAISAAKPIIVRHHYLHSLPAGTCLAFGVFAGHRLLGALTLGVGSANAYRLVDGAAPDDCLTLTRLWLSDELPRNSESYVLGIVLRALRRSTSLKFLLSYADPAQSHVGIVYQATGWLYTGLSEPTPHYDLGDGAWRHPRTLAHEFGTRSLAHFHGNGLPAKTICQQPKHRYIYPLDPSVIDQLTVAVRPYPKREVANAAG